MELETIGVQNAVGYRVPLWYNPAEEMEPDLGAGTRFRLIWVERGSGILRLGQRLLAFMAPLLLCQNEQERPQLMQQVNLKAQAIYFHPNVVHGMFTFENIRGPLSSTAAQDRDWLWAFLEHRSDAGLQLNLGLTSNGQVARLFSAVYHELSVQRDSFWPCRARSYFLELLFFVDRLSAEPEAILEPAPMAEKKPATGTEELLLYLHTHYAEKITLQQLSRAFHSNHTTLTQQFRTMTGQSIMPYLAQLRVRVASAMLRDTTLPIGEIMARVGFGDATHFGRTFRKYTNYTPSDYRQRFNPELQ